MTTLAADISMPGQDKLAQGPASRSALTMTLSLRSRPEWRTASSSSGFLADAEHISLAQINQLSYGFAKLRLVDQNPSQIPISSDLPPASST